MRTSTRVQATTTSTKTVKKTTFGGKTEKSGGGVFMKSNQKTGTEFAKTLPGIIEPTGFFDPLKLSANVAEGEVKRWREAELTHGRVAMVAFVGYLVGELPAVENNPLFNGAVSGPALTQWQQVEEQSGSFWELLLLGISVAEVFRALRGWTPPIGKDVNLLREEYTPGDLGFDPLGFLNGKTEAEVLDLKNNPLFNGAVSGP